MKIVDLNILLYAVNPDAPHHGRIVEWRASVRES